MTGSYKFRQYRIPARMLSALRRYIDHGVLPGDFLQAVLRSDFCNACFRADDENAANLVAFAGYLYNEAPRECHGSAEKVKTWVEKRQAQREQAVAA